MANKKVSQLVSKPSVLVTDLFPIADPTTGQLFKTTISDLGTAIGSGVSSVNTLVGAVVLDTDDIQELVSPTNKWFTDTRARAAISAGTGISYNSGTGVITNAVTSGQIATALGYTPADGANYLPLAGGTMGGAIFGTIATFASSTSVTALGITLSGSTGDGIKITHSAGRAFNIQSSGSGFGILINNETASTSAPFTIQKQGLDKITFTDGGAGTFSGLLSGVNASFTSSGSGNTVGITHSSGSGIALNITKGGNGEGIYVNKSSGSGNAVTIVGTLNATTLVKNGGTSAQFLKADGSVDSSTYALDSDVVKLTGNQTINGVKTFDAAVIINSSLNIVSGFYSIINNPGNTAYWQTYVDSSNLFIFGYQGTTPKVTINSSGNLTANSFIKSGGTSSQFLKADGSVDSTAYLPLSGGTLTGELNASGIKIDGDSLPYIMSTLAGADLNIQFPVGQKLSINDNGATNVAYFGKTEHRLLINGSIAMTVNSGGTSLNSALVGTTANFTGALVGTSATFTNTSTFRATGNAYTNGSIILENSNGANKSYLTNTNGTFYLSNDGSTDHLIISSTGAATFSSSVTANTGAYGAIGGFVVNYSGASTSSRSWRMITEQAVFGDFSIQQSTTQTGSTYTDRLYINPSGNVGIGTTAPQKALDIFTTASSATEYQLSLRNGAGANNVSTGIAFGFNTASLDPDYLSAISSIVTNRSTRAADLTFLTSATGTLVERMRITSGGNVGIGTTAPSSSVSSNVLAITGSYPGLVLESTGVAKKWSISANWGGGSAFLAFQDETVGAERMRITSAGALLVGATSIFASGLVCSDGGTTYTPFSARVGTTSNAGQMYFLNPNGIVGSITTNGSVTSFNITSDYRLKEDLKPINGLEIVNKIKVYDYKWKADNSRMDGVLAHELAEVLPYAVHGIKDGEEMQGVDYSKIVPVMVQAIKDLKAELDTLKNK